MAINLDALKKSNESINTGNTQYMKSKEIGEDTIVRLVPPAPELNGLYFFERQVYWFNNKASLISPSTFGDPCPIEDYLDRISEEIESKKSKGKPDKELEKLYATVKKKQTFLIPLLQLDCKYGTKGEITSYDVKTGAPRILECGPQLRNAIDNVVLAPKLLRKLRDVEDGITDRVEGYNISLCKTGTGLDTEYTAREDEQLEIDAKYYEKVPNLVNLTKKSIYNDDYINAFLDNYFYGDAAPEDSLKTSRYSVKEDKPETKSESRRSRSTEETPEEEPKAERPTRTNSRTRTSEVAEKPTGKSSAKDKSIEDDIEDLD